jgi:hypothetical protein
MFDCKHPPYPACFAKRVCKWMKTKDVVYEKLQRVCIWLRAMEVLRDRPVASGEQRRSIGIAGSNESGKGRTVRDCRGDHGQLY